MLTPVHAFAGALVLEALLCLSLGVCFTPASQWYDNSLPNWQMPSPAPAVPTTMRMMAKVLPDQPGFGCTVRYTTGGRTNAEMHAAKVPPSVMAAVELGMKYATTNVKTTNIVRTT
mmetsp:Transcript_86820/g.202053  ORF Transcript_86820/g.202053 Transcript_86820/m.202053 type:complete len:116 (-) Transcript_86820:1060-1407(-)